MTPRPRHPAAPDDRLRLAPPWVIGLFVGINLIFRGFNWIALGLALHSLLRPEMA